MGAVLSMGRRGPRAPFAIVAALGLLTLLAFVPTTPRAAELPPGAFVVHGPSDSLESVVRYVAKGWQNALLVAEILTPADCKRIGAADGDTSADSNFTTSCTHEAKVIESIQVQWRGPNAPTDQVRFYYWYKAERTPPIITPGQRLILFLGPTKLTQTPYLYGTNLILPYDRDRVKQLIKILWSETP